jgi:hypothetical protein
VIRSRSRRRNWPADHRRELHGALAVLAEPVQARHDDVVDRVRDGGVADRSHDAKSAVLTLQNAEVQECLRDFFDEERDTLGLVQQRAPHIGRKPLDPEHAAGHRDGVGLRQWTQRHPRLKTTRAEGRGIAEAMRGDEEDATGSDAVDEGAEVFLRTGVHPVKILEHEDERPARGAAQRHGEHRLEDVLAPPRGVHRADGGISGIHGQQVPDEGNVRLQPAEPAHSVLDFCDDLGPAVELVDAEVVAQLIDHGEQRTGLAERDAAAFEPRRRLGGRGEPATKFEHQPRLPDAGITREEHDLSLPVPHTTEQLRERVELAIASDEGREATLGLDVEPRLAPTCAQQLERVDRRVPLHGELAAIERFEVSRDEAMRGGADEHAARSGVLLQSRRDVRRVADGGVIHPEIVADLAHHDWTRVESDPHLEAALERRRQLAAELTHDALDRERGVRGAPRRVFVRDGRAEQRHHAVAGVLIDRALEAMHLGRDQVETTIDDRVNVLGIAPLGERAEAREVGEEHGHLPPLAFEGGARLENLVREVPRRVRRSRLGRDAPRCRGRLRADGGRRVWIGQQRASALVAKTTSRQVGMLASRTDRVQAHATAATELCAGRVFDPASRALHRRDHTARRCRASTSDAAVRPAQSMTNRNRECAMRSASSTSAGVSARAKMNPRYCQPSGSGTSS